MVAGPLNDFPILVSVTDPDLRDKAQSDGDDILFMLDSGISDMLYHEIEKYDSSKGELIAWVKIPSLSSSEDTTLFIYYGNPGVDSQQLPERVWLSHYVMVQHMNDVTSSSIEDSTIFDNDGIKKASYD